MFRSTPGSFQLILSIVIAMSVLLPGCSQKIDTHNEFLELAYQHERKNELPQAITAYRKALELNDSVASTWYDLGVAYAALNQSDDSVEAYSKAIELDPAMARAFNNRAAVYAQLKQFDDAVKDCSRAIELSPDDALVWRNRGLAYHDLGEFEKAAKDYDESIRISGRTAQTYHYRGNVYLELNQPDRALEDFKHAIHLDKESPATWLSQAKALAILGQNQEAEKSLTRAQKLGADVSDVDLEGLSPANAPAAPIVNSRQPAIDFVADWLKQKGQDVVASQAPWDLQGSEETPPAKYVVRVVTAREQRSSVAFNAADLSQLTADESLPTTLVVVAERSKANPVADSPPFEIVLTKANWVPDYSAMKPSAWTLPVPQVDARDESLTTNWSMPLDSPESSTFGIQKRNADMR